jgi:hypothetical protein
MICCPAELRLGEFCQRVFNLFEMLGPGEVPLAREASRRHLDATRRLVDQVMSGYCAFKAKPRWCEKSPANAENLSVLFAVFPDAQYLCLHRHGLDQIRSWLDFQGLSRHEKYLARHGGDGLSAAIDRWCTVAERLMAFEHAHPLSTRRLTYEDFVLDTEVVLAHVLRFLHLDAVPGLSANAFETGHDPGPSDPKIRLTSRVEAASVGRGRDMTITRVPSGLRGRFERIMDGLGYSI